MNTTQSGRPFALRIHGDAMIDPNVISNAQPCKGHFPPGTDIIVDPSRSPVAGDYVIASLGPSESTAFGKATAEFAPMSFIFRRLHIKDGKTSLRAINPEYPSIPLPKDGEILGVVTAVGSDVD